MKRLFVSVAIVVLLASAFQVSALNTHETLFVGQAETGLPNSASTVVVGSSHNLLTAFPLQDGLWNPEFVLTESLAADTSCPLDWCPFALPIVEHWNVTWDRSSADYGYAVAVDSEDEIIVTGVTGNMTYPDQETDAFLVRCSDYGELRWGVIWDKSEMEWGMGVAVDSEDNIIITGPTGNTTGYVYAFIAKYSNSGLLLWDLSDSILDMAYSTDVAVDSDDNIIVTGVTANETDPSRAYAFVAKYSRSGASLWSVLWDTSENNWGYGVAVDSEDNIIITGITGDMSSPESEGDIFVAKYSNSGVLLWDITGGGLDVDYGMDVAVDSRDDIIITGIIDYTPYYPPYGGDAFVAKFSSSGMFRWSVLWDTPETDGGYGVAVDSEDNIIVTGVTGDMPSAEADAFVAKCSGSGEPLWNTLWDKSKTDYGLGVAVDSRDNVIITGLTGDMTYPTYQTDVFVAKFGLVLTISIYTDKEIYEVGDVMALGLELANWNDDLNVCVVLWIERPNHTIYVYLHAHNVTLPAKFHYDNAHFRSFTLPKIPSGVYTWHAALLNPSTHAIIVEDTAQWEFS